MNVNSEKGMTVLEVAIAMTILLIGVAFIMKTDVVSHRYYNQSKIKEQMLFFASGIIEAELEGVTPTVSYPAFKDFVAETSREDVAGNDYLEKIEVKVYLQNSPTNPEPVVLSTYRVKK